VYAKRPRGSTKNVGDQEPKDSESFDTQARDRMVRYNRRWDAGKLDEGKRMA
jgi:hypothetical protein